MQIIGWVEKKFHFSQKQYNNDPYESRVLMEMAGFEKNFPQIANKFPSSIV